MKVHDATETAYLNGYKDALRDMQAKLKENRHRLAPKNIVKLVSFATIDQVTKELREGKK